ncbi:MAG: rod shape-determining protein [Desulfohalobiaceae bacterium]|nr:rod shape-determining protein [Desulfohalobiaceae bacterium]
MLLKRLFKFLGRDLAMDLGTANTLLYTPKQGIVLEEPSVVALSSHNGQILAVGAQAKEYLGRTPEKIRAVRPMKDGVIADFEVTKTMISSFVSKVVQGQRLVKPRMAVCVPTGITQVEKRAVVESAQQAGAREVLLLEEPVAAAIGAGLPITEPLGNMVVDIGGGTTEVAVISMSAVAYSESVRVAGDEIDDAIQRFIREEYRILVGETTAEKIKMSLGENPTLRVTGKDLVEGVPRAVEIEMQQVWENIREPINTIVNAVLRTLEKSPPELVTDVAGHGILMAGGGAKLYGLPELITQHAGISAIVDDNPLTTVLRGTGTALHKEREFRDMFLN